MSRSRRLGLAAAVLCLGALGACATTTPSSKDYTAFRQESPHSILVVPVLNNTLSVTAPDFFLSTISRPFAERGYYVFPAHMVSSLLQSDGLADAGLVHSADPKRLGSLFGCDSVLYVDIQRWDSKYVVISTTTTVKFDYTLKSCKTGQVLWQDSQEMAYSPDASNSGNIWADLLVDAVKAAMEKGAPNYMPMTAQANATAAATPGKGLPAGPYLPSAYKTDTSIFR